MKRKNVTLSIDEELWRKARKEYDLSLSAFLELRLVEYFALREGHFRSSKTNNNPSNDNQHIPSTYSNIRENTKVNNQSIDFPQESGLWGSLVSLWLREP